MENNLQRWFAAAAEAEPIVKVEEVGAMINTAPHSVRVKPTFKQFTIMGASFIVITSLVCWMQMPAEEVITARVQKPAIQRHDVAETTKQRPLIQSEKTWANTVNQVSVTKHEIGATAEIADASGRQVLVEQPILSGVLEFQHRMVYLTEKDFEKLDIQFTKNGYNHYYKTYAGHQKVKATQLRSVNDSFYFAPGYPGKNYVIKPWERDFYPLFLTDSLGNCQQNFHFQDCPAHLTYQQFIDSLRNDFLRLYTHLVPIAIRASAQGKLHVLWYKPTKELMRKLPDDVNSWYNYDSGRNSSYLNANHDFTDTIIQLSHTELANLGIRTNGNKLEYLNQYDTSVLSFDNQPQRQVVMAMVISVSESGSMRTNNVHAKDSILSRYSNEAIPLIITNYDDKDGKENFNILNNRVPYTKQSMFIKRMKAQLIPVVVKTKAKVGLFKTDRTFIFWYKNDVVFRDKLPLQYVHQLRNSPEFNSQELERYIRELNEQEKEESKEDAPTKTDQQAAQSRFTILSKPALKQLGIRFNGKMVDYKLVSYTVDSHLVVIDLGVTPDMYMLNNRHKSGKKQKLKWNKQFAWYITDSSLNVSSNFVDPLSQINNHEADEERMKNMNRLFMSRKDSLVPVLVIFSAEAVKQAKFLAPQTHLVFWFPKSEELQRMLYKPEHQEARKAEVKETAIAAIHYLELSDSALRQLGISKEGTFVKVPSISNEKHLSYSRYSKSYSEHIFTMGSDSVTASPPEKGDIMITVNDAFAKPMKVNPSYPKERYPEPVLITDGTGLHWRLYQSNDEPLTLSEKDSLVKNHINPWTNKKYLERKRERDKEWLLAKLNTMIAIRVKSDEAYDEKEDAQKALHPDLIIWYNPDSLFLSRLPQALALQIKDELNHVQSNNTLSACTYFESCANVRGALTAHLLYPNPTDDKTDLSITLSDARKVRVVITDISGKTVKIVAAGEAYTLGSHTIGFSVGNLSEGMYLLLIESDKGERIVQRMVKK
jgi:hypothetical protein